MVKIQIKNLYKVFSDGTSIGPINLSIQDGELTVLLGPSGSGKTTTLRMIAGFIKPDRGSLEFDQKDILDVPPNERSIGMVVQSVALFPNMTVFQNIAFALDIRDWQHEKIVTRVEELADMLGIRGLLYRNVNEISGGEGQRVALARALAHEPELLLLDEPLSALDPSLRENLQREIQRIQKDLGVTTVYVTHNQEEAFAIADKIAVLDDGKIIQIDSPTELYDKPNSRFVASFIGGGNIIEGVVDQKNQDSILVVIGNHSLWVNGNKEIGERVILSIKPEDIIFLPSQADSLTATINAVIPLPGRHRIELDFDGQIIHAFVSNIDEISDYEIGSIISFQINVDDVVVFDGE